MTLVFLVTPVIMGSQSWGWGHQWGGGILLITLTVLHVLAVRGTQNNGRWYRQPNDTRSKRKNYMCKCAHTHTRHAHTSTYLHSHWHIQTRTKNMHTYMYMSIHTCTHRQTHAYICSHAHQHITYTCAHWHITQVLTFRRVHPSISYKCNLIIVDKVCPLTNPST